MKVNQDLGSKERGLSSRWDERKSEKEKRASEEKERRAWDAMEAWEAVGCGDYGTEASKAVFPLSHAVD